METQDTSACAAPKQNQREWSRLNLLYQAYCNPESNDYRKISPNEKKQNSSNFHSTPTRREYFTVKYSKKTATFENIVTADVYGKC
ncbi:hypothetical protein AVEN_237131-1 [Araneus ventricosus]|uniref:Uncharacterized protein n=2 Tax=Araneus ventricosus TaxID=182803 RepID=A0A4Y2LX53_ARAVE|nr:hypothetical protein AVEN_237131-1 [Araneus ventricosus]